MLRDASIAEENVNFTFRQGKTADGKVKLTSPQAPGHEWVADSLPDAIREADRGIHVLQGQHELTQRPAWMDEPQRFKGDGAA